MQIFQSQTLQNLKPCAPQISRAPLCTLYLQFLNRGHPGPLPFLCFQVPWAQSGALLPQILKQVSPAPGNDCTAFPPFQPEPACRACQALEGKELY